MSATSKCPFGECDGSGITVIRNENGGDVSRDCKCAAEKNIERRIKYANIPQEFSEIKVNDFMTDIYTGTNKDVAVAAKMIAVGYIKNFEEIKLTGKGLFFYSDKKGCGKTRLAASVGNALIKKYGLNVKFLTTIALLNKIKSSFNTQESTESLISKMSNIDVLILDDIGVEKSTEWVNNIFYSIINDRMTAKKVTIFTSNTNYEGLTLDERIISRIGILN